MSRQKIGFLAFLGIVIILPLLSGLVAAATWEDFQKNALSFVSPIGFENQWTGIVIGILATIMLFAIIIDVAELALPFSPWVNWVIAIGLVITAGLLGLIRSIAGWGLTLGSYLVGGAGTLAILASAFFIAIAIIALFFGGAKLRRFAMRARFNRELTNKETKALGAAGDIQALKTLAKEVNKTVP